MAAMLLTAALAGCSALDTRQRQWIFQPQSEPWWGGASAAAGLQDVWIAFDSPLSPDPVRLHGLWHPQEAADAPVLLYLHGARWDVTGSASRIRRMHELGFSVLAIDYRGFGKSTPQLPSEDMAYEDARAAWQWLATTQPQSRRYIFGHSLGGAIAVDLAHQVSDESGLLVEGGFPSIADVFGSMRWGWLPLGPLITQRFDAASKIDDVGSPVLVVHGSEDRLIPSTLGRALFEKAKEPKRFELIDGGSHHNTNALGQDRYRVALQSLFGESFAR
jgi:alpha-beta hydrolase superfamily lysophospholipase